MIAYKDVLDLHTRMSLHSVQNTFIYCQVTTNQVACAGNRKQKKEEGSRKNEDERRKGLRKGDMER